MTKAEKKKFAELTEEVEQLRKWKAGALTMLDQWRTVDLLVRDNAKHLDLTMGDYVVRAVHKICCERIAAEKECRHIEPMYVADFADRVRKAARQFRESRVVRVPSHYPKVNYASEAMAEMRRVDEPVIRTFDIERVFTELGERLFVKNPPPLLL